MNSYPLDFLCHLRPVMFIAGLDVVSEPDTDISEDDRVLGKSDPFASLAKRLREALQEKGAKKGAIWLGERERSQPGYKMIMVDKHVRFPPRKATGHDSHSPLSPLTKTSPLYPDGLVAPIWVRKHTELLPAVFVLFLRLFEYAGVPSSTPISPLHIQNDKEDEKRKEEERKHDVDLSAEIALRKRACSERGIKLTVVLMASRKVLDDATLDLRLTFIRRQSGLDSRAALFVLSPVNATELQDFVQSLQTALHESALEYYGNHSKRVRRKRNRQAGSTGTAQAYGVLATPLASTRPAQPLRTQGWITRYEYKMGCFAEFRGEEEVARKHFQTSWEILVDMFGSIGILPPRTKRWAEAKVLADSISVKIIKLYLYRGEHSRAVAHFNAHLTRFADLNRIWGIGEDTWEFWSWIARWHRILAELVELALAHHLKLPIYLPDVPISSVLQAVQQPTIHQQSSELQRPSGMNPCNILQHPGFYYYAAAICTQRRLEQFIKANREADASPIPNNLANERKVDHRVIVLELYTKAYDWFKKHNNNAQGQNRFTFHLACRIAQTYAENGKFEMAIKFFERIAKTYRRERWKTLLRPVLSSWYTCCRETGDTDTAVKLLVEMICDDPNPHPKALDYNKELDSILTSASPSTIPLQVDLTDYSTIFKPVMVFWKPEVALLEQAPFQLHLYLPPRLTALLCNRLRIEFSDGVSQLTINHKPSDHPSLLEIQVIDFGPLYSENPQTTIDADLQYANCGKLILSGKIVSDSAKSMKFSNIVMSFVRGDWIIDVTLDGNVINNSTAEWFCQVQPPKVLFLQNSSSTLTVQPRQRRIQATFSHLSPAYLDEDYPITVSITNADDCPLNVVVDVLLHPAENETINHITLDDVRSNSLIKGVSYGILNPGQTSQKVLLSHSTGAAGDRSLDISVQCDLPDETGLTKMTSSPVSPVTTVSESLHSLTIQTASPFLCDFSTSFRLFSDGRVLEISDLRRYDASYVEPYAQLILRTTISASGPRPIRVEKISLLTEENRNVKLKACSLNDHEGDFPLEFHPGDSYLISCCFTLLIEELLDTEISIPSPGSLDVSWSRSQPLWDGATSVTTRFPLPGSSVPEDDIQAVLEIPAQGTLHTPFTASLRIRNKHPWRTADIHLQLEPSENFVVSGLRNGVLPILLAGNEDCIVFNLIPMMSGTVRLPTFKLFDRRKETLGVQSDTNLEPQYNGQISVLDSRVQERDARGNEIGLMVSERGENGSVRTIQNVDANPITLFVLPS